MNPNVKQWLGALGLLLIAGAAMLLFDQTIDRFFSTLPAAGEVAA